jgi:hypothetical protein
MILGLGVEYGVFMLSRYHEERIQNKSQEDSIMISVPAVGSGILGSGLTTTMGFLALTLSFIPMLQDLGLSLALGIFYSLISAVLISPLIFMVLETTIYKSDKYLFKYFKKRVKSDEHGDC